LQLQDAFSRLTLTVDSERLAGEVDALGEDAWRPHPEGMPGNSSLSLLAVDGDPDDDGVRGPMRPTPHLARCPYASRVLAALKAPIGRTRFMRIVGNGEARAHCDTNYYWQERLRVHVPVRTTPGVRFYCGDDDVHMAPGEVWVFDTWRTHKVVNPAGESRIHLVVDTVGSAPLWDMIEGRAPAATVDDGPALALVTESVNHAAVMGPWELRAMAAEVLDAAAGAEPAVVAALTAEVGRFHRQWRAGWARFGDDPAGWPTFTAWRDDFDARLAPFAGRVILRNGLEAVEILRQLVVRPAVTVRPGSPATAASMAAPITTAATAPTPAAASAPRHAAPATNGHARRARAAERLVRPVFIVSPPRSGTSLLFETLARSPDLVTIGGESHQVIESVPGLHPAARDWASNRLEAADATDAVVEALAAGFVGQARDRDGVMVGGDGPVRLLEKTPKNALRVPFLAAAFPEASFVYLYRDPRETISSMLDAWRSGRFVTYRDLPGWGGPPWSLLLTPGWREFVGRPLVEIVAAQWATTTTTLLDDLAAVDPGRWCVASFDRLVAKPQEEAERLCAFLGVGLDQALPDQLPPSRHTLTSPQPEKWRRNAGELVNVMAGVTPVAERARAVFAQAPATKPPWRRSRADAPPRGDRAERLMTPTDSTGDVDASPFRSVHTAGFAQVLNRMRASIAVSTYQSGRVILLRSDGDRVNTHLRSFRSPMGMARTRGLLSIATERGIWEFHEQPALAEKADPSGRTDTCFVPRCQLVTGDVRTHEIAYIAGELWAVNTRFSCLATFDGVHSFVPRWRPPFVTALSPEDRCHLNGLAVSDGRPLYVTAHGRTDEANGWRDGKVGGGVVVDVASGEVVVSGLAMPHSPRFVDGRLWLCDSGQGRVVRADPAIGEVEVVCELPGFTRGLAFAGRVAFVGLSQVREHVFADLPLGDRLPERLCGVWAIDTVTGATLGYIRFDGAVQEIFDVQLLRGATYPELVEPEADLVSMAIQLPPEAMAELVVSSAPPRA
jgi:uncharacterized protein (TIGR03032 family)